MNQHQLILEYLAKNGYITAKEAMNKLGIGRLASRVNELRQGGYNIITSWQKEIKPNGKHSRYAAYYMEAT